MYLLAGTSPGTTYPHLRDWGGGGAFPSESPCAKVRRKQPVRRLSITLREDVPRPRGVCSPGLINATGSLWSETGASVFVSSVKLIFAFLSRMQVAHHPVTNTDQRAWARTAL